MHDPQICVPFAWIRTQIADVFPLEGVGPSLMGGLQSMSSIAGPGAGLTQLWKDMMRDKVRMAPCHLKAQFVFVCLHTQLHTRWSWARFKIVFRP